MSVKSPSYLRAVAKVEPKAGDTITSQVHCVSVGRPVRQGGKPKADSPVAILNTVDAGHFFRLVYSAGLAATLAKELLLTLHPNDRNMVIAQVLDATRGGAA
ncbi:MAG: hypothetical protein ACQKBU_07865 [Verrucomicrobiales bacterium]